MSQPDLFPPEPKKDAEPNVPPREVELLGEQYRAEMDNVVLTRCLAQCSNCGGLFPISFVGLRRMGDGAIRNQPRCKPCRKYK